MRHRMPVLLMLPMLAGLSGTTAGVGERPEKRISDAETVLKAAATAPDRGIPRNLLERAECIGVFPGLTKGAPTSARSFMKTATEYSKRPS